MHFETLFSLSGLIAMIGWLILMFLPRRWRWLNALPSLWIPLLLSAGYVILIAMYFFSAEGNLSSLQNVQKLFTYAPVALAGWIHYLAFDLLIGSWIAQRADKLGISRLIQIPVLLGTFMFGPLGYLLFKLIEGADGLGRKFTSDTQGVKI